MYLKFDKEEVTVAQLKAIAAILELENVEDLVWFYNPYYEACICEVECVLENTLTQKELEQFKADKDEYEEAIERWANMVYYSSDWQWDNLYEKAVNVVDMVK